MAIRALLCAALRLKDGRGILAGEMWGLGRGRSRAMGMTWCRVPLEIMKQTRKRCRFGGYKQRTWDWSGAGGRLRLRGGWGALGGSLIPLCPLQSASSILRTHKTPQGELGLGQHTCLASLLPPSSFPSQLLPCLLIPSYSFSSLPAPAFRPLLFSSALLPCIYPRVSYFFPWQLYNPSPCLTAIK